MISGYNLLHSLILEGKKEFENRSGYNIKLYNNRDYDETLGLVDLVMEKSRVCLVQITKSSQLSSVFQRFKA